MTHYTILRSPLRHGAQDHRVRPYEPLLAVVNPWPLHVIERPRFHAVTFRGQIPAAERHATINLTTFHTDRAPRIYGTNHTPRDRMRHEARLRGERPPTNPYSAIGPDPFR